VVEGSQGTLQNGPQSSIVNHLDLAILFWCYQNIMLVKSSQYSNFKRKVGNHNLQLLFSLWFYVQP
jgi:hypothetical protein